MDGKTQYVTQQTIYKRKYKHLKRHAKDLVYINAALCDEIVQTDEKANQVKEQRKFLLKKLFQHQSYSDAANYMAQQKASNAARYAHCDYMRKIKLDRLKQEKIDRAAGSSAKVDNDARVPVHFPVEFDLYGRPQLPMTLSELTILQLGQVDSRPGFHSEQCFYPPGFHSTRRFASVRTPHNATVYNCRVLESGTHPVFEMSPDDLPEMVIRGHSPDECHRRLLSTLNDLIGGRDKFFDLMTSVDGAAFFGLTHPTVLHYYQSFPSSQHCNEYTFVGFRLLAGVASPPVEEQTPASIGFAAFRRAALRDESDSETPAPDDDSS